MRQRVYRTQSPIVSKKELPGSVLFGSESYRKIVNKGTTFRFIKRFHFEPNYKYPHDEIVIALTVSAERIHNVNYYSARWRQYGYGKNAKGEIKKGILRKVWIGKIPTLKKLDDACNKLYFRFCRDNKVD